MLLVALTGLTACGAESLDSSSSDDDAGSGASASGGASGGWGTGGSAGTGDWPAAGSAGAAGDVSDAGSDAPQNCGCLLGEGAYCAARAAAEATAAGCEIPELSGNQGNLLACENDQWKVLEQCKGKCEYDASSPVLDDACVLPVCDCFVQVAWCGAGAAKEAQKMGCRIPLLPEHDGDILYCPNGKWSVKQSCSLGCVQAPTGTPDYCKSNSDYRAPFTCNTKHTCSNGNATSSHSGKDQYAYDFAMPVGTTVRAMRSGTVHRVRMVSKPGSACYNGGGSSCANYANTVEVKHSDGTIALYMHLSSISVKKGDPVAQGAVLGKSGNSGWSTGPHTHVQVQKDCGIWWCQSIPFKLVEGSTISAGTAVTSKNCP